MNVHAADIEEGIETFYVEPSRKGYLCIKVLEFLNGKPWDDIVLGYIHSLRPFAIRISYGEVFSDSVNWRVTVFLTKDNHIDRIVQEVEVALPDGCEHGAHLRQMLTDT